MGVDIFKHFGMDENLGANLTYRDFKIKSWCIDIPIIKECINSMNFDSRVNIVEIGVHGGGSLLRTFDEIEGRNCSLYGIDCWENIIECGINGISNDFWEEESLKKFLSLHKQNRTNLENILEKYDKSDQVTLIHGFSTEPNIIGRFEDNTIDLLYIDGDHSFDGCYNDLKNWYPKLKTGGFILNDDYSWETVKNAVEEFGTKNNIIDFKTYENQCIFRKI